MCTTMQLEQVHNVLVYVSSLLRAPLRVNLSTAASPNPQMHSDRHVPARQEVCVAVEKLLSCCLALVTWPCPRRGAQLLVYKVLLNRAVLAEFSCRQRFKISASVWGNAGRTPASSSMTSWHHDSQSTLAFNKQKHKTWWGVTELLLQPCPKAAGSKHCLNSFCMALPTWEFA